jgi:Cu(I)/Ag(I) efflux system membrane fusion protein
MRRPLVIALLVVIGLVAVGALAVGIRSRYQRGGSTEPRAGHADDPNRVVYWTCPMHPDVKADKPGKHDVPGCGMDLVPVRAKDVTRQSPASSSSSPATTVTGDGTDRAPARPASDRSAPTHRGDVTIDPRRQQLIGVRIVVAKRSDLAQTIRAVGLVRYDETRQADINVKIDGWIRDLYVDYTGQFVRVGQPLFTLYSPDLLNTQSEYLMALKTREQLQSSQIADARQRADALVEAARQRLLLWDLSVEQIRAIEQARAPQAAVTFRSAVTGFVTEKQAVKGAHVMPGQTLYKVADLSVVWVEAAIYETELPLVRVGGRAMVTLDAYPDERFTGRVVYIYPYVDENTRTTKVRYAFPNARGHLKPGMYANVELSAGTGTGVMVPTNAVLDSGKEQLVFVSQGEGHFEPRRVKIGRRLGADVQIIEGVKEGERVATGATFFLDSESQLRASLQGFETPPADAGAPSASRQQLDITLRSVPDPVTTGENQFEVTVKDPSGKPVDDAQVTVQFFMAAMPTMNMPAMRSEAKLSPAGGGVYRGSGNVRMAGRWDVTITVTRNGQRIGGTQTTVVAR